MDRHLVITFVVGVGLGAMVAPARSENCAFNRDLLVQYDRACKGGSSTACANIDKVQTIVKQSCGDRPSGNVGSVPSSGGAVAPSHSTASNAFDGKLDAGQFAGKECSYFTRPAVESEDGVTRMNYYADGSSVCYQETFYQCTKRRWEVKGACSDFPASSQKGAEVLER